MKTINKYELEITTRQTIKMPYDPEILYLGIENEKICLWALVDPGHKPENINIEIYGTGNPINSEIDIDNHLGTVQLNKVVLHVFESKNFEPLIMTAKDLKEMYGNYDREHNNKSEGELFWIAIHQLEILEVAAKKPL